LKYRHLLSLSLLVSIVALPVRAQNPEAIEHYRTGYDLLKNRNYRNAAIELEQAVLVDPSYGAAFYALAQAYKVLNEYPKAIDAFERARQLKIFPERIGPELAQLYHKSAIMLYQQRKYREAITSFEKSLADGPGNAKAYFAMGLCYNGLKDTDRAKQTFSKAIKADPQYAKPYKALGDLQRRAREYGPAAATYRKAISVDSTFMDAYGGLAQVMMDTKDLEGTVALMGKAVGIDSKYATGFLLLGTALNSLGRQHEAVDPLRRATALQPKNAKAHYRLGEAYYGKGDYRDAVESGKKASRLERNYHAAELLLGDAYSKLSQIEDARTWYTRAMQDSRFRDYAVHQLREVRGEKSGPVASKPIHSPEQIEKSSPVLASKPIHNPEQIEKKTASQLSAQLSQFEDTRPPQIDLHRGLRKTSDAKQTIKGQAIDESGVAIVEVNGREALLDEKGNFEISILLKPGANRINISAIDIFNNRALKQFVIERKSHLLTAESLPENPVNIGEFFALLIAIQDYQGNSISDLDQPVNDAQEIRDTLLSEYTFNNENVILLENPSRDSIINAFDQLARTITDHDNLFIFFAGHGYWDEQFQQGYWLPSDAIQDSKSAWLSNSTIRDYIRGIQSKHTLLVSDACFSGGIFKTRSAFNEAPSAAQELYKLPSRKAMTSGTLTEVPDRSIFVSYFLKKLRENEDQFLSSGQLFLRFREAVINNSPTRQIPQFGEIREAGDEGGDFIFVKK